MTKPSGSSGATLVAGVARGLAAGVRVAWVSLEDGDNDPARFWAYFVAALQTIGVDVGKRVLSAFQSAQAPAVEPIMTTLVNEIAATSSPFLLILDDYHEIQAQPIHDALSFLVDHLPPQMHLVIATRADPPLSLARLRGRGQLTEVRLTDLRFTLDEATEFLNRATALGLSTDDVAGGGGTRGGGSCSARFCRVARRSSELREEIECSFTPQLSL